MKKSLLVFTALFISNVLAIQAQHIILVTDVATGDVPYVERLQAEGYTVESVEQKYRNLTDALVPELNAADLIIFTRRITSSGAYGGTDPLVRARWQSITAPILQMADVVARMSRTQLLNNDTPNGSVNKYMVVKSPGHIVFKNTILNSHDSTKILTNEVYQCTSATDAGNGTLLATDPVNGWVTMAEWDSNTACYSGAGVQNGRRFWYAASNTYNYTADGERLFLDIVEYMLTKGVTDKLAATDIQLSDSTILEGKPAGTVVGLLSDNDPQGNTASFSLVDGEGDTDNVSFIISGDTLKTSAVFEYLTTPLLSVRIQVADSASNVFEKVFTIKVISKTEPYDIVLNNNSILEGEPVGTIVDTLKALDPQGNIASYALVAGTGDTDNASFTIDSDTLRTAAVFDYEVNQSLSVRIQVTDSTSNVYEKIFIISVIGHAPTDIILSKNSIPEGEPEGTTVGGLNALDTQDDIATYALISGEGDDDNASFAIDGDTLRTAAVFNYDNTQSLSVRIQVTDLASNTYQKVFTINVQDKPSSVDRQTATVPEIYPNPARNYLIIKNVEPFAGSISSISGQTIMTIGHSNANLDISALEVGLYIITITSESGQYVYRFIKE